MLVELSPERHGVAFDIAYARADNVTGKPIYARPAAWLVPEAEAALLGAAALARAQGLGLLLFDAFRPLEAQWALWRAIPDPAYISDPRRGGIHTRGVAVDLTLTGPGGKPLDMGTGFDDLTPASHHGSAAGFPASAAQPRAAARPDERGRLGLLHARMVALPALPPAPLPGPDRPRGGHGHDARASCPVKRPWGRVDADPRTPAGRSSSR